MTAALAEAIAIIEMLLRVCPGGANKDAAIAWLGDRET